MQQRMASSVYIAMRKSAGLMVVVVCVALGCASGPETRVLEAASSFQGEDRGPVGAGAAIALKDPFAEMARSALSVPKLKNPFVRLSPKLRNPFAKARPVRRARRAKHRARRVAELPDLALKDPFARERIKNPFR
jgi:hypothetical protein